MRAGERHCTHAFSGSYLCACQNRKYRSTVGVFSLSTFYNLNALSCVGDLLWRNNLQWVFKQLLKEKKEGATRNGGTTGISFAQPISPATSSFQIAFR